MRSILTTVTLAAALAGCGASGTRVTAKIEAIQRNCGYTQTETNYRGDTITGRSVRDVKKDCSEELAFQKIKRGKSNERLSGEADVFVRYKLPGDEYAHSAHVVVSARDKRFYTLEPGQDVKVRIDAQDSNKAYL